MQFTLQESCSPSLATLLFQLVLLFGPPVSLAVMLWIRRDARDPRDVLLAVTRRPEGLLRRSRNFLAWLVPTGALLALQAFAMLIAFALMRNLLPDDGQSPAWLVAPMLAAGALLLAWMRREPAARDVLHVEHAPRRRR